MTEKRCSKCGRVLPAACFNKAKWLKSGLRPDCKGCYGAAKRALWLSRPPSAQAIRDRRQKEAAARGVRICLECLAEKPISAEAFAVTDRASGRLHTRCRECAGRKTAEWAQKNWTRRLAISAEQCARRYSRKKNRTPQWLTDSDFAEMRATYRRSASLSQAGVEHNVDHVVPLFGRTVSGLHVPWNLQVIPARDNRRKHNGLSHV